MCKPKLLVIGQGRSGKDTFAEIANKHFGYKFTSSSQAAADIFIYDILKDKHGYSSPEECYNDRHNHRALWHDLICQYNSEDKARLAKEVMKNNDIYVGMRNAEEIKACLDIELFDLVVGVTAYERVGITEDETSNTVDEHYWSNFILTNDGDEGDFERKVIYFLEKIKHKNT